MAAELQLFRGECPRPSASHPHVVEQAGIRMACYYAALPVGAQTPEYEPCDNPHPHGAHARFLDGEDRVRRVWCIGARDTTAAHRQLAAAAGPRLPERLAVCEHDVRGPLRQACCCCGVCDHLDFRVADEVWAAVVPARLAGGHVCLRCFDAMATRRGIPYASTLGYVGFVGDGATISFEVASYAPGLAANAVKIGESRAPGG